MVATRMSTDAISAAKADICAALDRVPPRANCEAADAYHARLERAALGSNRSGIPESARF
jgi:hypothetical protein